jgi:hypothetical protein
LLDALDALNRAKALAFAQGCVARDDNPGDAHMEAIHALDVAIEREHAIVSTAIRGAMDKAHTPSGAAAHVIPDVADLVEHLAN